MDAHATDAGLDELADELLLGALKAHRKLIWED